MEILRDVNRRLLVYPVKDQVDIGVDVERAIALLSAPSDDPGGEPGLREAALDALAILEVGVDPGPHHMATLDGRAAWIDRMTPVREHLRAALSREPAHPVIEEETADFAWNEVLDAFRRVWPGDDLTYGESPVELIYRLRDERDEALAAPREAGLRDVVEKGLNAPSGEPICCCYNRNAVKAGMESPCWYCELRAALGKDKEGKR